MPIDFTGIGGRPPLSSFESQNINSDRTLTEPPATTQATGGSSTADTVSITDRANQLTTLETQVAQLPVVDTQRVEAAQQAIASNSFEINPERTADNILAFEQQLLGRG